jgi:hypothetical protein
MAKIVFLAIRMEVKITFRTQILNPLSRYELQVHVDTFVV